MQFFLHSCDVFTQSILLNKLKRDSIGFFDYSFVSSSFERRRVFWEIHCLVADDRPDRESVHSEKHTRTDFSESTAAVIDQNKSLPNVHLITTALP